MLLLLFQPQRYTPHHYADAKLHGLPRQNDQNRLVEMEKITEKELRDYGAAGVVKAASIVSTPEGYVLGIQLTWKRGDLVVFTHRGRPRAWASMDRLLLFVNQSLPNLMQIDLDISGTSALALALALPTVEPH